MYDCCIKVKLELESLKNVCRIFKNSSLMLETDSICFKKYPPTILTALGWLHYAAIGRQFSTKLSPLGSDRPGDTLWLINVYLYITIDDYDDDDDDDGHGAKRPHNQTGRQCSECMPDPTAAFPSLFGSGLEIIRPDTLCPVSVSQQRLYSECSPACHALVGWSVGLNVDVGLVWPGLAWRSGFPDAVAGCHFGAPHHWSFRCAAAALGKASH